MTSNKHRAVVAAQPGFEIIEPVYGDNGPDDFDGTPVVAWIVDFSDEGTREWTSATPVTVQILPSDYAIKSPDGRVIFPEDEIIDPGPNWREEIIKKFRKAWQFEEEERKRAARTAEAKSKTRGAAMKFDPRVLEGKDG